MPGYAEKRTSFFRIMLPLGLLAGLICLASFFTANMLYQREYNLRMEEVNASNRNTALFVEESVRRMLSESDDILIMMKTDMELLGRIDPAHQDVLRRFMHRGVANQISVADRNGELIFSAVPLEGPLNISTREHFAAQINRDTERLTIAAPLVSRATGTPAIFLSRRLNDRDGNFAGIVTVGIDPDYLDKVFSRLELSYNYSIVLLRADGSYLGRVPNIVTTQEVADQFRSHVIFDRIRHGETSGAYEAVAKSDAALRIGWFRMMPEYPVIVLAGVAKESVLRSLLPHLQIYYYWAAALSAVLVLSLWIIRLQTRRQDRTLLDLDAAQDRYRVLLKQAAGAVAIAEFDTLRIVEVNEAFLDMFGYSETEALSLALQDIVLKDSTDRNARDIADLTEQGVTPVAVRLYQHKLGRVLYVQRAGTVIDYRGQRLIMVSYHDISLEQKLQTLIQTDVQKAGAVQRSLLPKDILDRQLQVKTIFEPVHFVSGDLFGYRWSRDHSRFLGYLIDVTGHGMGTALHTATVSGMLNEMLVEEQDWTPRVFAHINKRLLAYFPDDSFVGMMAFTVDFRKKTLSCVAGGINYFIACSGSRAEWVGLPGNFLGMCELEAFEMKTLSIKPGDTFFFMTDGIQEATPEELPADFNNFAAAVGALRKTASNPNRRDDCSAVCLKVRNLDAFPLYFDMSNPAERDNIRRRIRVLLQEVAGPDADKVEVSAWEAVANARRYGAGVRLKLNLIGSSLILRVKDDGIGFDGNGIVSQVAAKGVDRFLESLQDAEHGRGIPIMMAWMDRVVYNREGNELMLVKNLRQGAAAP